MNKHILSLVGVVDSLIYLLESNRKLRRKTPGNEVRDRLERMRRSLLAEGFRQAKILGAVQDTISEVAAQLGMHLSQDGGVAARDAEWVVRSLTSSEMLSVDPPPLPSSSSGHPNRMEFSLSRARATTRSQARTRTPQRRSNKRVAKVSKPSTASRLVRFPDGSTMES